MRTLKDLGMTEQDAVLEIEYMRGWDKYLSNNLDAAQYLALTLAYARMRVSEELRNLGATEDDITEVCDAVEKTFE